MLIESCWPAAAGTRRDTANNVTVSRIAFMMTSCEFPYSPTVMEQPFHIRQKLRQQISTGIESQNDAALHEALVHVVITCRVPFVGQSRRPHRAGHPRHPHGGMARVRPRDDGRRQCVTQPGEKVVA